MSFCNAEDFHQIFSRLCVILQYWRFYLTFFSFLCVILEYSRFDPYPHFSRSRTISERATLLTPRKYAEFDAHTHWNSRFVKFCNYINLTIISLSATGWNYIFIFAPIIHEQKLCKCRFVNRMTLICFYINLKLFWYPCSFCEANR